LNLPRVRTETKGSLVRDCPGTRNHICCGYKTIDLVEGCMLSCSYCILRGYLNAPHIKVHDDLPYILALVEAEIDAERNHILRFGTGELGDSLALERELGLHRPLIQFFGEKKRAILELKSKWASIRPLQDVLNPYTVVSYSLAPSRIIAQEEKRTSPLHKRLKVLKQVQDRGGFVGLHFDPIIIYPGFEKDYYYLIEDISSILDLKRVIWVSMGLLRFMPKLYTLFLLEGRCNLLHGEFIRGEDGKYRYIKAERIRVYKMLYELLKSKEDNLFIYLCMERPDIWREVTGMDVATTERLVALFDGRVKEFYGGEL
jgi:spore photoproduct lyase